jgi:hypothetical protein
MSDENFVLMSKELKEEYDTLMEAGYTDDEIRAQLMEKFNLHTQAEQNDDAVDPESSDQVGETDEAEGDVDKPIIVNNAPFKLEGEKKLGGDAPSGSVKGKKMRKRRGTFENDAVVTAKPDSIKSNPDAVIVEEVVEVVGEGAVVEPVVEI